MESPYRAEQNTKKLYTHSLVSFISTPLTGLVNSGPGVVVGVVWVFFFFFLPCMNKSPLNQDLFDFTLASHPLSILLPEATFSDANFIYVTFGPLQWCPMTCEMTNPIISEQPRLPVIWHRVNHEPYFASSLFSGTLHLTQSSSLLQKEPSAATQNQNLQGSLVPLNINTYGCLYLKCSRLYPHLPGNI